MDKNEYQKNLENFFKLKNKYYEKINREKQKLISNTELTKKEKRLKYRKQLINVLIVRINWYYI